MRRLGPIDATFLYAESREQMMHVAGLLHFSPPPRDAAPDFFRRIVDELREHPRVHPPWNLELRTPDLIKNPLQAWVESSEVDLEYHVRRSALPSPGDERELGVLVSRLHSNPIDFHRPPWEAHLIEGLSGGRFAIYVKVHHSLVDGFTAMRILARSLSRDPDERDKPLFFSLPPPPSSGRTGEDTTLSSLLALVRQQAGSVREVGRALLDVVRATRDEHDLLIAPMQAPKSILNRRIGRNRRFATQQFSVDRLKEIARAIDGTLNDVVLALCAGGLRRFLLELDALPRAPLIAMLPVNVRPKDDPGGGNAVGAILASLATDVADPLERARAIVASTRRAKMQLQGMSRDAIVQYGMVIMAPLALQLLPGTSGRVRPAFNVVVSNVPGPEEPLYFRGARLEATYPMSIPFHGHALNITCQSYAGTLNFGFIGCRDTLPRMQRLAVYTGEALTELETAIG